MSNPMTDEAARELTAAMNRLAAAMEHAEAMRFLTPGPIPIWRQPLPPCAPSWRGTVTYGPIGEAQ